MEKTRRRVPISGSQQESSLSSPLTRGIGVLVYVWRNPGSTLADIHRGTSVPKSSLVRILRTLTSQRVLSEGPDGRYWQGPAFSEPSVDAERVTQVSHPLLVSLAQQFGETVGLFWIDGHTRVCLDAVESTNEIRRVLVVGQRRPMDVGCTAGAALAFQSNPRLPHKIPQYTSETVTDVDAVRQSWNEVRRTGFCITHNQTYQGVSGVAAPILSPDGVPVAVISVTGPEFRFRSQVIHEWGEHLVTVCTQIADQLHRSI